MQRMIGYIILLGGLLALVIGLGFVFRIPAVIDFWPWPDSGLSYLFEGSILLAVSAAAVWIGWSGELGALPAGALNIFVIAIGSGGYLLQNALYRNRIELLPFGLLAVFFAVASALSFMASRRILIHPSVPTPWPVQISFMIFLGALVSAGIALIFHLRIFPWALNPDSSVLFGCIFIGDAFYFLYSLLSPHWNNAKGQLLSFLAYDVVLIGPFIGRLGTIQPDFRLSLILYIVVLVYSGVIAAYYLFFHAATRSWPRYTLRKKES
jgi:hypothetical protein